MDNDDTRPIRVFMRIAIPVFGNRISPRFDFAPMFALFDLDGKNIAEKSMISCNGWHDTERVSKLKDLAVDLMICGGLPNHLLDVFENSGIRVIPWVAGDAAEALSLFLRDRLVQGMAICPGKGRTRQCRRKMWLQD